MNSKILLITIIITLCAVGLYLLSNTRNQEYPQYTISVGQLADFDLIAPFDFPILKTEKQISLEYQIAIARMGKPYSLNPDKEFEAYSYLDKLFELLFEAAATLDKENISKAAHNSGLQIDNSSLLSFRDELKTASAYQVIKAALSRIYKTGVYDKINADSILFVNESGRHKQTISTFLQLDQAKRDVLDKIDPTLANLVEDNAESLIMPNIAIDENDFALLQKEVIDSIDPVAGKILRDEQIIRKNGQMTENDVILLDSLAKEYENRGERKSAFFQLLGFLGILLYIFVVMFTFNLFLCQTPYYNKNGYTNVLALNMGLLFLIGLALINNNLLHLDSYHIPFAMLIITAAILIGYDFAVFYMICGILIIGPFVNWEASNMALLLLSSLLTLALIRKFKARHEFLKIWLFLFVSLNMTNLILDSYLYSSDNLGEELGIAVKNIGFSMVSVTLSILGCIAIVSYFERKWNRATKQVLLELLDFEHPLLKRLATNAVGTYHHSLIVGNLAERAAEAIGANPLLARVGSYYHDIGKVANPEIFTENNEESEDIHSHFSPEESANLIRNHVKEGVVLATKYHIPQAVIDIIIQHHGTGSIRYFLGAAERKGEAFDRTAFRYPGPLPQTKEAALVMLADVVESTTKSKSSNNDEEILKIFENTMQRLIREGQFEETPITLKDMSIAKMVMLPILESIYRKRMTYPEDKTS